jgi:AraC-like DNA-binding protein
MKKPAQHLIAEVPIMREVIDEMEAPPAANPKVSKGVCVTNFDGPLADCALCMVRLLDTPKAIPILYPAIMREICYWLLTGPQGSDVVKMTLANSYTQRVITAVHTLHNRFAEPVRIEELASIARMSPSAFHRQCKAITSMTPLQYQKQLRLLETRRLMVSNAANVETAAFQVGYESPSQFSREYSRMFAMS